MLLCFSYEFMLLQNCIKENEKINYITIGITSQRATTRTRTETKTLSYSFHKTVIGTENTIWSKP